MLVPSLDVCLSIFWCYECIMVAWILFFCSVGINKCIALFYVQRQILWIFRMVSQNHPKPVFYLLGLIFCLLFCVHALCNVNQIIVPDYLFCFAFFLARGVFGPPWRIHSHKWIISRMFSQKGIKTKSWSLVNDAVSVSRTLCASQISR